MDHSTAHVLRDSPWTMMALLVTTLMNVKWTMATALRSVSISLVTTPVLVLMDMSTQGPMVLTSSVLTLVSSGNRIRTEHWRPSMPELKLFSKSKDYHVVFRAFLYIVCRVNLPLHKSTFCICQLLHFLFSTFSKKSH